MSSYAKCATSFTIINTNAKYTNALKGALVFVCPNVLRFQEAFEQAEDVWPSGRRTTTGRKCCQILILQSSLCKPTENKKQNQQGNNVLMRRSGLFLETV